VGVPPGPPGGMGGCALQIKEINTVYIRAILIMYFMTIILLF
jgi:hypothetical protein